MSVRAYLIKNFSADFEGDDIIFKKVVDRTPLFNVWRNANIFDIFQSYGCDLTNQDAIGEVTLSKSDWMNFKKNFKKEDWSMDDIAILNNIDELFKKHEDIWLECL